MKGSLMIRSLLVLALGVVMVQLAQVAFAAQPDTARALKTLMGEPATAAAPMGPQAAGHQSAGPGGMTRVVVQRGDTLFKILAKHGALPPDRRAIFGAMVSLNPEAFISGNQNRLRAGAVLMLPTAAQLQAVASGQMTAAALLAASAASQSGSYGPNVTPDPHKGWVRYPSR